jgi:hypothetical protein
MLLYGYLEIYYAGSILVEHVNLVLINRGLVNISFSS